MSKVMFLQVNISIAQFMSIYNICTIFKGVRDGCDLATNYIKHKYTNYNSFLNDGNDMVLRVNDIILQIFLLYTDNIKLKREICVSIGKKMFNKTTAKEIGKFNKINLRERGNKIINLDTKKKYNNIIKIDNGYGEIVPLRENIDMSKININSLTSLRLLEFLEDHYINKKKYNPDDYNKYVTKGTK